MIEVAEACLQHKFEKEPLIVGTSGRYEYRNKGLDLFMESLKRLASCALDREILAYITVPAANNGARADLVRHLADKSQAIDASQWKYSTHYLENRQWDPISQSIRGSVLESKDSKVKVQLGLCKGKKLYDKRESAAKRDAAREIDRSLKSRNNY
jgi:phosphorylase/glycogen(starch) synthase